MKKIFYTFIVLLLVIGACSKSSDSINANPELLYPKVLGRIEAIFDITIEGKEQIDRVSAVAVSNDQKIVSLNGDRDGHPWLAVFDLISKKLIFEDSFTYDPLTVYQRDDHEKVVKHSYVHITAKTKTHIYGYTYYERDQEAAYFIGEIKTNKIVENNNKLVMMDDEHYTYPWFAGQVLIADEEGLKVIEDGNRVKHEFTGIAIKKIQGVPISDTKTIYGDWRGLAVYSIEDGNTKIIEFDPKDHPNDRVKTKNISSKGNLATVVLEITTYDNRVSEKTVVVDFETYTIVD